MDAAVAEPVCTTTFTGPVVESSGTCRLISVGLTYQRYAGLLSMVTVTPPKDVGKSPFQRKVPLARLLP